jgi:hypothetical protein
VVHNPRWPRTCDFPASPSQSAGIREVCTTTPSQYSACISNQLAKHREDFRRRPASGRGNAEPSSPDLEGYPEVTGVWVLGACLSIFRGRRKPGKGHIHPNVFPSDSWLPARPQAAARGRRRDAGIRRLAGSEADAVSSLG